MKSIAIAGNLGRDAEHKTTQSGQELCSFSVAVDDGYGENKGTLWFDVTKWGKGTQGLAGILRKGSKVAVSGELSTRDHGGKTYLQVRANDVTIQGTPGGNQQAQDSGSQGGGDISPKGESWADDLDDDIGF